MRTRIVRIPRTTGSLLALARWLLLLPLGLIAACATTRSLPTAEELLAQGAITREADLDALRAGRAIAVTECAQCHRLYWPEEYSPGVWPGIVKRMGYRASLSASQIEQLEYYFVTVSRSKRKSDQSELE